MQNSQGRKLKIKNTWLLNHVSVHVVVAVEVLLKAAGDAPIMMRKKWQVDGSKQVAYIIEFIKKYIKCEPQDSLVSLQSLIGN